jgi:phage/plasmid primase-like uncharacterized protein
MRGRHLVLTQELIGDGRFHRCDAGNKEHGHGKNDGVYVLHLDGVPRGGFVNYTDGKKWQGWVYKSGHQMTKDERRELDREVKELKAKANAMRQAEYARGAAEARKRLRNAKPASKDHAYLVDKGVHPHNRVKQDGSFLLIPAWNKHGKLSTLQIIDPFGCQKFMTGGRAGGSFYKIEGDNDGTTICVCEGYATAASIHAATGHTVFVAFNDHNLKAIAKIVRERYPDARILICADDDWKTEGNPGITAAREAAQLINGCVAIPTFPAEREPKTTDFNDMMVAVGTDAVKKAIDAAGTPAQAPMQVDDGAQKETNRIAALAATKLDDPLTYDQQRRDVARDLHVRVSTLDEQVERLAKELMQQREEQVESTPIDMNQLEASARNIIECEDVLELFADDCGQIIAGEKPTLKILYLAATTRLFEKAMHLAIKGASAIGKSEARKAALAYFPPECVVNFTTLSEKALLYFEGDFQHKVLSMGEAHGREESDLQNYLLRELMTENILRYHVPQKIGGKIKTVLIEKHGPVAFVVTTTRNQLNAENETRMLSLELDDSEEQTRAVVEKIALVEGLNRKLTTNLKPWHDYQRWLAAGVTLVQVPYAPVLSRLIKNTKSVRLRRDWGQLLRAIKAHALMHRAHRKLNNKDGVIIANIEDYAVIRKLMAELLATAVNVKVRKAVRETVERLAKLFVTPWLGDKRDNQGATVREIADALKLDMNTAWRRLRAAEHAGLVVNVEEHEKRLGRYRITGEKLSKDTGSLLPTTAELEDGIERARAARERKRIQRQQAHAVANPPEIAAILQS